MSDQESPLARDLRFSGDRSPRIFSHAPARGPRALSAGRSARSSSTSGGDDWTVARPTAARESEREQQDSRRERLLETDSSRERAQRDLLAVSSGVSKRCLPLRFMKEVAYAVTVSVVAATHLSRDAHGDWLDACYTVRADASQTQRESYDSTEPIHWASGLPCFTVFYVSQLLLALAYRRADPARSWRMWCAFHVLPPARNWGAFGDSADCC